MVDRLKTSLQDLTPPDCPKCHAQMGWFSSQLVDYSPVVVEHRFQCSNCGDDIRRRVISADLHLKIPPTKLSKPRSDLAA